MKTVYVYTLLYVPPSSLYIIILFFFLFFLGGENKESILFATHGIYFVSFLISFNESSFAELLK